MLRDVFSPAECQARFGLGRGKLAVAACVLGLALASSAYADPINLVQNGSFETTTATNTQGALTVGSNVNNMNLSGWQINGCSSTATTCGFQFIAQQNVGTNGIWNAINNQYVGFYSTPGASPDGGNAFVSDGAYQTQALTQTINNLNVGDTYVVKFYQASMQQTGYTGAAADSWAVGLANGTNPGTVQYSAAMNNPSQGSTGWVQQTMSFVASATSQTLFFFATSTGSNPPFLLLDGVSMTDVPEPATLGLLSAGLASLAFARRRKV